MRKRTLKAIISVVVIIALLCSAAMAASCKAVINSSSAKVYKSPTTSALSIKAPKGVTVTVTAYKSGWARISYKGHTGYMKSKFLTLKNGGSSAKSTSNTGTSKIDKVCNLALSLCGRPYGGNAPSSFNCSSLVRYCFNKYGYSVKGTAAKIAADNSKTLISSTSQLKKGDILCFDTNGSGTCDHVGIYLGGGKFVEASQNSGKVQTNTLDNWYKKHFICARRV